MSQQVNPESIRDDVSTTGRPARNYLLLAWVIVPAALLLAVLIYLVRGDSPVEAPTTSDTREPENYLQQIRSTLARQTDLATCRVIVAQLNSHLRQSEEHQPAKLTTQQSEQLANLLGLQSDELAELGSTTFTPLDARHLESCFLFRDAAKSLELSPMKGSTVTAKQSSLDRAKEGFAWVMRQVRLVPAEKQVVTDLPTPPALVLRRGTGSALERALVYLALLEQFGLDEDETLGLQGVLMFVPDEKGQPRFWCCGVTIGNETAVYLFDPRMGLPLPGPQGKGIATLEQATTDPSILNQLKIDKLAYDITPEQVKTATVSIVCPLSAASPRMRLLQDKMLRDRAWRGKPLPHQVRVRLAEDPFQIQTSLRKVVSQTQSLNFWKQGVTLSRQFFGKDDGGVDTGIPFPIAKLNGFSTAEDRSTYRLPREQIFNLSMVPWEEYPAVFRDPQQFRFDMGLGQRLRGIYAAPFLGALTDPKSPREQALRGNFKTAVQDLAMQAPVLLTARNRLQEANVEELYRGVSDWILEKANPAFAFQLRSRGTPEEPRANRMVDELFKWRGTEPIAILLTGAIAGPRSAEVMYQLALYRQEQAHRQELRLALAKQAGLTLPGENTEAELLWKDTENYWREFLENHPNRPASSVARLRQAESQIARGEVRLARSNLEQLATLQGTITDLERLACLWLANQLPSDQ